MPHPVVSLHANASYDNEHLRLDAINKYISHNKSLGMVPHDPGNHEIHLASTEEPTSFANTECNHI
jgi:hypothetical protein